VPGFALRRLRAHDAPAYRELRLEGLRSHPEAFAAAAGDEAAKPPAFFAERLETSIVWVGSAASDTALLGVAGLQVSDAAKLRHKAVLWGMYVCPAARGTGLATALAAHLLDEARGVAEEVRLSVVASNHAAIRLYGRLGFQAYALDPRALKVAGAYHDEMLMVLRF
jgi:ribosomal protein S18 acetylase RimI-like enzyme